MGKKAKLHLAWCNSKAATYACETWHYSRKHPSGKSVRVGVWENDIFIGCVIFGTGASPQIGKPFGLKNYQICELTRVALNRHKTPVTRIVSIAIKMLRKQSPALRMIISYADPEQGHHGGIYQGGNWVYVGVSQSKWTVMGLHNRSFAGSMAKVPENMKKHIKKHIPKYKYCYPLDNEMKQLVEKRRKTFPAPVA